MPASRAPGTSASPIDSMVSASFALSNGTARFPRAPPRRQHDGRAAHREGERTQCRAFHKGAPFNSAMTSSPMRRALTPLFPARWPVRRSFGDDGPDGRHLLERIQIERPIRDEFKRASAHAEPPGGDDEALHASGSMTCRPVRLFIAENKIDMDEELVDLMTGAHMQPPYANVNPNWLVPMLEDGDLKLTESSAILKYLADKVGLAGLSQGPETARQGQRDDGLDQHQLLSRLGLQPLLPAALPAHEAAQRRGAGRHARMGQGEREALAQAARTTIGSGRTSHICAATDHDRRLFRRRPRDARRGRSASISRPIRTSSAGSTR